MSVCVCVCVHLFISVLFVIILAALYCVYVKYLHICTHFLSDFLFSQLRTEDCLLKALLILAKGLQHVKSKVFQNVFIRFLLGEPSDREHQVQQALVSYMDHISEDISYAALHLFDSVLSLPNANVMASLLGLRAICNAELQGRGQTRSWFDERQKAEDLVTQ